MNSIDCRDRTSEFFSTIQQIQKTQNLLSGGGSTNGSSSLELSHRPIPKSSYASSSSNGFHTSEFDERPDERLLSATQPKQQSQFTQAASHIGRSIGLVTEKLEKLGKLAKQRSLFNDPASEINELTYIIKGDLSTLSAELTTLHAWVLSHRGDDSSSGQSTQHATRNSTAIVDSLKQKLMVTTKSFQEVLQVRTNNLKEQNARRKQFEAGSGNSAGSGSSSSSDNMAVGNAAIRKRGGNAFDALMNQAASRKQKATALPSATTMTGFFEDHEATSDIIDDPSSGNGSASIQDQLLAAPVQSDTEYLNSRAQAVENIETIITELGEMYSRLVHIVGMQEEITVRIDENMTQSLEHIEGGHDQLLKYYEGIKGNRWLILKVFGVLLVFIVFFMLFVA